MGYMTRYELDYYNGNEIEVETYNEIYEYIKNNDDMSYALIDERECKWYMHDKDMLEMSKHFPNVIFKIHGEGEEIGDLWEKYYKNGKMQICEAKITYEPYDENKLKEM